MDKTDDDIEPRMKVPVWGAASWNISALCFVSRRALIVRRTQLTDWPDELEFRAQRDDVKPLDSGFRRLP
jgi:hypothetical protein